MHLRKGAGLVALFLVPSSSQGPLIDHSHQAPLWNCSEDAQERMTCIAGSISTLVVLLRIGFLY